MAETGLALHRGFDRGGRAGHSTLVQHAAALLGDGFVLGLRLPRRSR